MSGISVERLHAAIWAVDQRGCGGTHMLGYGMCQELGAAYDRLTPLAPSILHATVPNPGLQLGDHFIVEAANPDGTVSGRVEIR